MPDSQIFEDLPTCAECVAAGYGWSVSKQRCGGYRNKVCIIEAGDETQAVPAPGPWMLGEQAATTAAQRLECGSSWWCASHRQQMLTALVLGLAALAVPLLWRQLGSQRRSALGGGEPLPVPVPEPEPEPEPKKEQAAAGARQKRRRAAERAAPPAFCGGGGAASAGILKSSASWDSEASDRRPRTMLWFKPTPDVRHFKRWQKPLSSKPGSPSKAEGAALRGLSLIEPHSLDAEEDSRRRGGERQGQGRGSGPAAAAPAPAPGPADLAYIFGPGK